MATYTPNLNFKKPLTGEHYDMIADLNDAKDKIDSAVGDIVTISIETMIKLENGDVTKGIQRGIDEAIALNKAKILLSGVYETDAPLIFERLNTDNNTSITFFGGGQIKKSPSFIGDRLLKFKIGFHDEDNIVFDNISFNGVDKTINCVDTFVNSIPYNSDGSLTTDGELSKFVKFKDCTFQYFYRAVRLSSLSFVFYSCLFEFNIYGAFLNLSANNNTFYSCQFRRNVIGAHLKQLNSSYGTLNNVFNNCNFESNNNAGLINENADYTGLHGGYFENNCYAIDTNYPYPPLKCHIQFIGYGNTGNFNALGVFFNPLNMDCTIYGDQISSIFAKACGSMKINADVLTGEFDGVISDITLRSMVFESNFIVNGVNYIGRKTVISKASNYDVTINSKKSLKKEVACGPEGSAKITLGNLKMLNTDRAIVSVKCFIDGVASGGASTLEGYIERDFRVYRELSSTTISYQAIPLNNSVRGMAFTKSGIVDINVGESISTTSDIIMEYIDTETLRISLTNLVNSSLSVLGYAVKYVSFIIVEIEGVLLTWFTPDLFTREIIELT